MAINKLNKQDAVFGRGRKKNHIRQGNVYRTLVENLWLEYGNISPRNQKERKAFIWNRIIKEVLKEKGRFIMREGDNRLRLLSPKSIRGRREIERKIQR